MKIKIPIELDFVYNDSNGVVVGNDLHIPRKNSDYIRGLNDDYEVEDWSAESLCVAAEEADFCPDKSKTVYCMINGQVYQYDYHVFRHGGAENRNVRLIENFEVIQE